jgi:hypothetical protein
LRLRPQPNDFLEGELVVHKAGYGVQPIKGFIRRGNQIQFEVQYGLETFDFQGSRQRDVLRGTFDSTPSGDHGTWTTHVD